MPAESESLPTSNLRHYCQLNWHSTVKPADTADVGSACVPTHVARSEKCMPRLARRCASRRDLSMCGAVAATLMTRTRSRAPHHDAGDTRAYWCPALRWFAY